MTPSPRLTQVNKVSVVERGLSFATTLCNLCVKGRDRERERESVCAEKETSVIALSQITVYPVLPGLVCCSELVPDPFCVSKTCKSEENSDAWNAYANSNNGNWPHWERVCGYVCVHAYICVCSAGWPVIHNPFGWLTVPQTGWDGWSLLWGACGVTTNQPQWACLSLYWLQEHQ